ncbi:hypothetical protein FD754_018288 [Muntiacus muntjak]|uniref:60S ribosomal protein L3 n=1 Tax=Muntiacus muntjak TaxID=9888 RepID=A0A5N3UX14_MUNMU|nr:hypothetical protein FD754_018288 [Muntiacus muntjak]
MLMSHRKFSTPRHWFLGFLPQKCSSQHQGKVIGFTKDDSSKAVPGSKLHKKEVVEPVTVVETMPFMPVGTVGRSIFAEHISNECKRYKHLHRKEVTGCRQQEAAGQELQPTPRCACFLYA